jgi:hypothetical protein
MMHERDRGRLLEAGAIIAVLAAVALIAHLLFF